MAEEKKKSFWSRILFKYRLTLMNDENLTELWHFRMNWLGVSILLLVLFLLSLALCSLLILYTPLSNALPGAYTSSGREELIDQTMRLDSLSNSLEQQRLYVESIRQVVAGEISTDSVAPLDSFKLVQQEKLLEARSAITEEFNAQFEAEEKAQLHFVDPAPSQALVNFVRPIQGVKLDRTSEQKNQVTIRAEHQADVMAVLEGTIVSTTYTLTQGYCVVIQHRNYISIYRQLGVLYKQVGDKVKEGEAFASLNDKGALLFELWENGEPVNPTSLMSFN